MFRRSLLLVHLLFPLIFVFAGNPQAPDDFRKMTNKAFADGEKLVFDVKYGFVTAGIGTMEIPKIKKISGRDAYYVLFTVNTVPSFDWIFKVRDRYETYLDKDALFPWRFEQHIRAETGAPDGDEFAGGNGSRVVGRAVGNGVHDGLRHGHDALCLRDHQQGDGLSRKYRVQPAAVHAKVGLAYNRAQVCAAVLPDLGGAGGREVGEPDGIGDSAAGLIQDHQGQHRIVALGGEDGKLVGIVGGGGNACAPDLATVAIVVQIDLKGEGGRTGGRKIGPNRAVIQLLAAKDAQDVGLCNGAGNRVRSE